jgi:hypothetical protein
MLGDLILLGVAARFIFDAMDEGRHGQPLGQDPAARCGRMARRTR